jgi:hypothetical protein
MICMLGRQGQATFRKYPPPHHLSGGASLRVWLQRAKNICHPSNPGGQGKEEQPSPIAIIRLIHAKSGRGQDTVGEDGRGDGQGKRAWNEPGGGGWGGAGMTVS